jgi:hypothetical protein
MKHQKEWRACDRCGEEIKVKPISELEFMPIGDYFTPSPIFEDGNVRGEIKEIHSNILFPFGHTYDLCPKCRKDFEEFMRNDQN